MGNTKMDQLEPPGEYRHRTSNTWEAASLWAAGWPVIGTELGDDGRSVIFLFPDGGEGLRKAAQDHLRGELTVSSLALREGYRQMREMVEEELRDADAQRT